MIVQREEAKRKREAKLRRRAGRRERRSAGEEVGDSDEGSDDDDDQGGSDIDMSRPNPLDGLIKSRAPSHPSSDWKPTQKLKPLTSAYANRKRQADTMSSSSVPSLSSLVVSFLIDNFEGVRSLGGIDSASRSLIGNLLAERNMLDDEALAVLQGVNEEDTFYGANEGGMCR